jgi:hypothetical protein
VNVSKALVWIMPSFFHKNISTMKNLNIFALALLLLTGCAKDLGYQQAILGTWQAVNWTVGDKDTRVTAGIKFEFKADGYSAALDGRSEQGSYRIDGDKLYSHAVGQQEIMVKITKLNADSLAFEMNRGGTKEHLTLVRE